MTTTRPNLTHTMEGLVDIDGQGYYAVPDVDELAAFLMSVVSDGDRWMFLSSTGGLTAGRGDSAGALFPYETDDRLHHSAGLAGPVTAFRVLSNGAVEAWSPFRGHASGVRRNLYKSVVGDTVVFEEVHQDLQLGFRYRWASTDRFGFVRTASISNLGNRAVSIELIDGLLNVLPHGLHPTFYQAMSNLSNAYKRSELIDPATRLAVFSLESHIVDRPEPSEALRGSVVWSVGLDGAAVTVDPDAVAAFEKERTNAATALLTGRPGAYLLTGGLDLAPDETATWHIVADVAKDQPAVAVLRRQLRSGVDLAAEIMQSVHEATDSLVRIMAPADAAQRTGDRVATAHQFANVTYNVMRGGIPLAGYTIDGHDFATFVRERNRRVGDRRGAWLEALPDTMERDALMDAIVAAGDADLVRLGYEYLPFSFSRRHGDPSRPWNTFSIRVHDDEGRSVIYYEGNWRDIFQNWEALCMSFPEYLPSVVSVFVNASTPDGYNPYRITRHGIDWEIPEPDNPWSHIGYWGDHQIVYLLRLLQASDRYMPGEIVRLLGERWFSYADVPYRIVPYEDLVSNPKSTIHYDEAAASRVAARVAEMGADGKLVSGSDDGVYLVTLAEKLVVPALTKLSNFVPGGGIWMNTQRPEWNDANNALVGFGLSMVTLYQLRSYLDHLTRLTRGSDLGEVGMSTEVAAWLATVTSVLREHDPCPPGTAGDQHRKRLMDELGSAFSDYRSGVYASGFTAKATVRLADVEELCRAAIGHLDATIRDSRRSDGLYHSYNLIHFAEDGSAASIEHLDEMLEGQVAVLESGVLSPEEHADVVDALFTSALYRADQKSFILYPARHLPSFLEKNVVPEAEIVANPLLSTLLEHGERSVITRDADGRVRFDASFANERALAAALDRLANDPAWAELVASHRSATMETYEKVFNHHAYTGRSGSMHGYEGIGSIYWHMVAKLLVAVQESALGAVSAGAPAETIDRLVDAYWRTRAGLGFNKTAAEFGAIPTDPYSHTPAHAGAKQPGMTGLVKEELLTRPLELGVRIEDGRIGFDPILLRDRELLTQPEVWRLYDLASASVEIPLAAGSLGMTVCQVPVVIAVGSGKPHIDVEYADGTTDRTDGLHLDRPTSRAVFARKGEVVRINAFVPAEAVRSQRDAMDERS